MSNMKTAQTRLTIVANRGATPPATASARPRNATVGQMMAIMEWDTRFEATFGLPSHAHSRTPFTPAVANQQESGPSRYRADLRPVAGGNPAPDVVSAPVPAAADAATRSGLAGLIGAGLTALWRWYCREREIAKSMNELFEMDDRALRDIGLHRSQIPCVVRFGLDDPTGVSSEKRSVRS
jgi:uncharacterized protein YjiS (DUF1127 family)